MTGGGIRNADTIMKETLDQSTASEPICELINNKSKGEFHCLAAGADIDSIQDWLKSADATTIKAELFSRDSLQQTPLSQALIRGDKQTISLLLSLGE